MKPNNFTEMNSGKLPYVGVTFVVKVACKNASSIHLTTKP